MSFSDEADTCLRVNTIDQLVETEFQNALPSDPFECCLVQYSDNDENDEHISFLTTKEEDDTIPHAIEPNKAVMQLEESMPWAKLKMLPKHLQYAYLGNEFEFPIIISSSLFAVKEKKLLKVLKEHKSASG